MGKVKVSIDKDACIACGTCVAICPDNWEMGSDGKAQPKKAEVEEAGCNQQAADSCPVSCIKVETEGE